MTEPLNHTPGPFIIDEGIVRPEDMIDSIRADPTWVAVGIADEDGYSSSVAYCHPMNAPLFAAAPDLLNMLQRMTDEGAAGQPCPLTLEHARAAIVPALCQSGGEKTKPKEKTNE